MISLRLKNLKMDDIEFEIGNIYPNPSSTAINIPVSLGLELELQLVITNVAGKVVYNDFLKINQEHKIIQVDINKLSSGMYYLKTTSGENTSNSVFVKE